MENNRSLCLFLKKKTKIFEGMPAALQHPELNPKIGHWSAAQKHEKYFKNSWKSLELKSSTRRRGRSRDPHLTSPPNLKSARFPWLHPALLSPGCWHHLVASKIILIIEKQQGWQPAWPSRGCQPHQHPTHFFLCSTGKCVKGMEKSNPHISISGAQGMIIRNHQSKQLALISFLSKTVTLHLHPCSWQYHSWADFQDFHITGILQNTTDIYTAVNSKGF